MKIGKNEIRSIYGEAPQSFHNMMVETLDSLDEAARSLPQPLCSRLALSAQMR